MLDISVDNNSSEEEKKKRKCRMENLFRRRLKIDKNIVEGLTFKIAQTSDELEQAYKLVYEVYKHEGYTDTNSSEMRLTPYHTHPDTVVFIGLIDNKVITTMSLFPDSSVGLAMDDFYNNELNILRKKQLKIAELGALATHATYRSENLTLPIYLMKIMHMYAENYMKLDNLVITVHPKHALFYTGILLFKEIGGLRECSHTNGAPIYAFTLDLNTARLNYKKNYKDHQKENNLHHFMCLEKSNEILLPKEKNPLYVWDAMTLKYFFEIKTNTFSIMSTDWLEYVLEQHEQHGLEEKQEEIA